MFIYATYPEASVNTYHSSCRIGRSVVKKYCLGFMINKTPVYFVGVEPPSLSNINLLMAAAISSSLSERNNNTEENETPKDPISVEKAIAMWKNITERGKTVSKVVVLNILHVLYIWK